jgi:hypothetical protein
VSVAAIKRADRVLAEIEAQVASVIPVGGDGVH